MSKAVRWELCEHCGRGGDVSVNIKRVWCMTVFGRYVLAVGVAAMGGLIVLIGLLAYFDTPEGPDGSVLWSTDIGRERGAQASGTWWIEAVDDIAVAAGFGALVGIDAGSGHLVWRREVGDVSALARSGSQREGRIAVVSGSAMRAVAGPDGEEVWRHVEADRTIFEVVSAADALVLRTAPAGMRTAADVAAEIVAVDMTDGTQLWRYSVPADRWYSDLAATDGMAYVVWGYAERDVEAGVDEDGEFPVHVTSTLVAVDVGTGHERWRRDYDGYVRVHAAGSHLVVEDVGRVIAVDPATGTPTWERLLSDDEHVGSVWELAHQRVALGLSTDQGGRSRTRIAVVDATDGAQQWTGDPVDGSIVGLTTSGRGVLAALIVGRSGPHVAAFDKEDGRRLWQVELDTDGPDSGLPVGVAGSDTAVLASLSGTILALDPSDGTAIWTLNLTAAALVDRAPALDEGVFYLAGGDGLVRAIDAGDGRRLWQQRLGTAGFSQPHVHDGVAYAVTGLGSIQAFDATSGEQIWRGDNNIGHLARAVRPVVSGDVVVGGATDQVWAVDLVDGHLRWDTQTAGSVAGLAATSDLVIATDDAGTILGLEPDDGRLRWQRAAGAPVLVRPVVSDRMLFVVTSAGRLLALSSADGELQWQAALAAAVTPPPVAVGEAVYVTAGSSLHAFSHDTGEELWHYESSTALERSPAVANGLVHVATTSGVIFTLDATTGDQISARDVRAPLLAPPLVFGDVAYARTQDGRLLAFR
jgi:outer membrane protein assembly factor BamB